MTGDEATALYRAEKAKRAGQSADAIAVATARLDQLDAEREARQLGGRRRGRTKLAMPVSKAERDDIRDAAQDALTWERITR